MIRLNAFGIEFNFHNNDEEAIQYFDERFKYGFTCPNHPCFGQYYSVYKEDKTFYLTMPMVYWIEDAIKQWNNKFENIKVEIVKSVMFGFGRGKKDRWGDSETLYTTDSNYLMHSVAMFKFNLNPAYNKFAQFIIPRMVGTILRYLSVNDRFSSLETKPTNNIFEYICEVNSDEDCQNVDNTLLQEDDGNLSELTVEVIEMLDNIELMNKAFEKEFYGSFQGRQYRTFIGKHFYQTAIWNHINDVSNGLPIKYPEITKLIIDFNEEEFIRSVRALTGE